MAVADAPNVHRIDVRFRGREWLGWAGGAFLGAVLLVAAAMKSLDPAAFAEEITALGLAGPLPPFAAAIAALFGEALLGALLVANVRRLPVMIAATLLVAFFLLVTGRSAWRAAHGLEDATAACGCFGNLVDRTPAEAFRQDLALLLPALALAWFGRPRVERRPLLRRAGAATLALGVAGFATAAPGLPLDDVATRLKPGVAISELCAGRGAERVCLDYVAPPLASGVHLVILADTAAADFPALAERLNAHARAAATPPIAMLAEVPPERRQELFWTISPAFDLHDTPQALLRPLYRTLPRSFRVEDGRVTATWNGPPPELAGADRAAEPTNSRG
jgi:hypothetical protein